MNIKKERNPALYVCENRNRMPVLHYYPPCFGKLLRHGEQLRRMVEDRKILPVIISVEQVISKKSPM